MQDKDMRTWPLALTPGGKLSIEADASAMQLQPVPAGETPRLEAPEALLELFEIEVEQNDNDVSIEMSHRGALMRPGQWLEWFKPRAKSGLVLYVPEDLDIAIETEAGKVTVSDLRTRRLAVSAEAGAIALRRVSGRLKVEATAGKVDGEGLSGSLDVASTSGAVRLGILALDPGHHTIETEVGSIQVELPQGAPIAVKASARLGAVTNDFASISGAPATLEVAASVGSVRVREGAPAAVSALAVAPAPRAVATQAPPAEELARVLKMVEAGTLSAEDAAELIKALEGR